MRRTAGSRPSRMGSGEGERNGAGGRGAGLMELNPCGWNGDASLPSIPFYRLDIFSLDSPNASLNIGLERFKPFELLNY